MFLRKASTASTPSLLAKTLSKQLGAPPLCKCPKTETLTSYSGKFSSTYSLSSKTFFPVLSPSATITIQDDFPEVLLFFQFF